MSLVENLVNAVKTQKSPAMAIVAVEPEEISGGVDFDTFIEMVRDHCDEIDAEVFDEKLEALLARQRDSISTDVVIGKNLATFFTEAIYDRNRTFKNQQAADLAYQMKMDQYVPDPVFLFGYIPALRRVYLYDRQHTGAGIADSGKTFRMTLKLRLLDTVADLGDAYSKVDIGRNRNNQDMAKAKGLKKKLHFRDDWEMSTYMQAVKYIAQNNIDPTSQFTDVDARIQDGKEKMMAHYYNAYQEVVHIIKMARGRVRRFLKMSAVVSVMVVTLHYCPKKAREFWELVAKDDAFDRDVPHRRLQEKISEWEGIKAGGSLNAKITKTISLIYNKWCEGGLMKQVTVPKAPHLHVIELYRVPRKNAHTVDDTYEELRENIAENREKTVQRVFA